MEAVQTQNTGVAKNPVIQLRQRANFWQAQHARAIKRATAFEKRGQQLEKELRTLHAKLKEKDQQIEVLKAKLTYFQQQLFGRKSEQTEPQNNSEDDLQHSITGTSPEKEKGRQRKRGQQPGAKGHGRQRRTNLPAEVVIHDVAEDDKICPQCRLPRIPFFRTEDSEEVHWETRLVRRIHKRRQYLSSCRCPGPRMVTAPPAPKIIPKGMFSIEFWVWILMEKFLLQRPLYRVRKTLAMEGLDVSQGTLTGGLKRLAHLLHPLYALLVARSRSDVHWHMDETRWMVFADHDGKTSHRWWLWVIVSADTCVFVLDPSRSSQVPKNHLGEHAKGIISADRYSAYKALRDRILIAFCWSHVRRDFLRVFNGYKKLRSWAENWITRIDELFRLNNTRVNLLEAPLELYQPAVQAVLSAVENMAAVRDRELAAPKLHSAKRKVLQSLVDHWQGLTIFVDYPEVPMDNNEAERRLRNSVVGRKNYYGSGSVWSGCLSAVLFSIFQTLVMNNFNPKLFLLAYFEACVNNGVRPPDNLDRFMPWNLSEAQRKSWYLPEKPP
jgi:transposase